MSILRSTKAGKYNFIEKWLTNHPNDDVKKFYPQLVSYFENIYEQEAIKASESFVADNEN